MMQARLQGLRRLWSGFPFEMSEYTGVVNPDLARDLLLVHLAWIAAASITTFTAYGVDKRRAKKADARRIPERTLHRLSWLGGAPGGWLGRRAFRHKTRKRGFARRLTLASLLHAGIAGALGWAGFA